MPAVLMSIVTFFLRALLPALLAAHRDTSESSQRQPELTSRLRARIRSSWGSAVLVVVLCCTATLCGGCFMRTIYVPDAEPVRLRQDLSGVKVWILDANGKPVPSKKDLKEGCWVLSDEAPKEK